MKIKLFAILTMMAASLAVPPRAAAQGVSFTYQGRLNDGGAPANGSYDLQFILYDARVGGSEAGPILTNSATDVSNGLFTVTLNFGAGVFTGSKYWLDISVRTNGGGTFAELSPRQELTPTPYAIFAEGASNVLGVVPGGGLGGVYSGAVTFNNGSDSFTGNGGGLTNVNALTLAGHDPGDFWQLSGNDVANGQFLGSTNNHALELRVNGQRVFRLTPDNTTNNSPNILGGSPVNLIAPGIVGATIGGGGAPIYSGQPGTNQILGDFNTIGGGWANTTGSTNFNVAQATVGGGAGNTASGISSTIAGGSGNLAYNNDAAIAGGFQNQAGFRAAVGGGQQNFASGAYSAIGGGALNNATNTGAFVGGGGYDGNNVAGNQATGGASVVGGGIGNTASAYEATVGGGAFNTASGPGAFVGGGGFDGSSYSGNSAQGGGAAIGGGVGNTAVASGDWIGAGHQNAILQGADDAAIGAGLGDIIGTNSNNSFIGAGYQCVIGQNDYEATISGGWTNVIGDTCEQATIGGGSHNLIQSNSFYQQSFYATIGGGAGNTAEAEGATIPGGENNEADGVNSFAAGNRARASQSGAFVWADDLGYLFDPYAQIGPQGVANSFNVRSTGGFYIVTGVDGSGNITAGAALGAGATSWSTLSDRNAKKNFQPADGVAVLNKLAAIPIEQWNYKWEKDGDTPNLGPMAQDFKAAFYPGRDDKSISTLEFDGVELAAIQGLNQKVKEKDAEIQDLKTRLEALEKIVLNQKSN